MQLFKALRVLTTGLTVAITSTCASPTSPLTPFTYGAFTQTATYSIANQLGFFTANGLNVTYRQIPNSPTGFASLSSGEYDVITATIDNAVNFRFNSQRALTVLGQLDQGPDIVLASVPSVSTVAELRGKTIMVDNPTSGFAFLLRKILSLYGLQLGMDYSFQVVGGTALRYQYLLNGSTPDGTPAYATLLTYPFTAEGAALPAGSRPNILARASDFVAPFSSSAFTATTASTTDPAKAALLIQFLTAILEANIYLATPKRKACVVNAIATQLNITQSVARTEYTAATDPVTGEVSQVNFEVNRQGLLNVIDLRAQYGGFAGTGAGFDFVSAITPGVGKLVDYTLRDRALAAVEKVKVPGKC